jgi:hypothetical protein
MRRYFVPLLSCLLWSSSSLTAPVPLVPEIKNDGTGLVVSDFTGDISPEKVSGIQFTIKNDSGKEIAAYVIAWNTITHTGKMGGSSMYIEDKSLLRSSNKMGIGATEACEVMGSVTASPNDSFERLEVWVDYILFTDGTSTGPNKTRMAADITNRRQGAKMLRSYLQQTYQQKGIDSLLEELNAK